MPKLSRTYPPPKAHCPTCGFPCCAGASEHAAHGGTLPASFPRTVSLSVVGNTHTVPIPNRRAAEDPLDDDPIDAGLAAVRFEGVFGHRPGE